MLIDLLDHRAARRLHGRAYGFQSNRENEERQLSFTELRGQSRRL